jgi:regulator of replication initiation timing
MSPITRGRKPYSSSLSEVENHDTTTETQTIKTSTQLSPEILEALKSLPNLIEENKRMKEENKQIKEKLMSIETPNAINKDAKRRYGYELDGVTRRAGEDFDFRHKILRVDGEIKAIVAYKIIKDEHFVNHNTGKLVHSIIYKVTCHDGTSVDMDSDVFIRSMSWSKYITIPDSDIKYVNGEKVYTFRTTEYGTFSVAESSL